MMRLQSKFVAKSLAVVLLLVLPALAQVSNAAARQESATDAPNAARPIVLDVIVSDKSGKRASDLSRIDFTVQEDKDPQMIADFERPDQHRYEISTAEAKATDRRTSSPALTILVVDWGNAESRDRASAVDAVTKYLQNYGPRLLQPTALLTADGKQLEFISDYTEEASDLQAALKNAASRFASGQGQNQPSLSDRDRVEDILSSLKRIAAANMDFAGRKNVIWIGQGLPALTLTPTSDLNTSGGAARSSSQAQRQLTGDVATANEIWKARLAIYTIDVRGLEATSPNFKEGSGGTHALATIATETGAKTYLNRNNAEIAIANAVNDGTDYYTLSYYPKNAERDGKFRDVTVAITRPGLEARTRSGYYAAPEAVDLNSEIDAELTDAVTNPLPYRGLGVSVKYKILSGTPRMARYTIAVDRHDLSWQAAPNGDRRCEIVAVARSVSSANQSSANQVAMNDIKTLQIKTLEGTVKSWKFDREMNDPMSFTFTDEFPLDAPGVRVVVRDQKTGRIGTADLREGEAGAKTRER
jgi:VWFA-related protein